MRRVSAASRRRQHASRVLHPEVSTRRCRDFDASTLDWPTAENLAREALPLAEAIHRQELIASNNRRLAKALARQGKAAEALPHARRAVEIYIRLGSPRLAEAQATLAECEQALAK